mmetsp:Transcript_81059/g.169255  ORF Transcript_81059/g.169255 Transcript_81059/m.169255 type:complete len:200 (+) Transcript_81059:202-801(+)
MGRGGAVRHTRSLSEVALSLAGLGGASEQDSALAERRLESELVEGHAGATSLDDAGSGGLGEAQSADGHLGDFIEALVVGDGANDHGGLALLATHEGSQLLEADGSLVLSGHVQALVDDLVELGVGTASQELVQPAQELHIGVLRLGLAKTDLLASGDGFDVNTHGCEWWLVADECLPGSLPALLPERRKPQILEPKVP